MYAATLECCQVSFVRTYCGAKRVCLPLRGIVSMSAQRCLFSQPDAVQQLTCSRERVVCLQFPHCGGQSLYAHPAFLSAWSSVLRNCLEAADDDVPSTPSPTPHTRQCTSPEGSPYMTIPLDEADTAAWQDALALMHPSRQLFKMTWDSAARLLLLAHKYDMPAVTAHVEAFLMDDVILHSGSDLNDQTAACASSSDDRCGPDSSPPQVTSRLEAHLTPDAAVHWLHLTSMCGLDQQAVICINYMVRQQVPLSISLLSGLQPKHADELLSGLLQQLQEVTRKAERQEQQLSAAALPIKTATRRGRCPECRATWYKMPDGRSAPHCFSCGKRRPIILGDLYPP